MLGDELLETFPCFVVSESLKSDLIRSGIGGVSFNDVTVTKSQDFMSGEFDVDSIKFYWMKVDGRAGTSDLGVSKDFRLVASDRAMGVLRCHRITNAKISDYG